MREPPSESDSALEKKVREQSNPGAALGALVRAIPREVPVALLVDEYDAAIIADVSKHHWEAAKDGIAALRSLLMSTKSLEYGSRIERCIVTGVAKFARASLFSGANNFKDLTENPQLSAAIGFSEQEIRTDFPKELAKLANSLGKDVDETVAELARHYNGYCFDGQTTCFNPYGVLSALESSQLTELELAGATGTNWLGLTAGVTMLKLMEKLETPVNVAGDSALDVADLEAKRVNVIPLLLQTGILTVSRCQPPEPPARKLKCVLPNEYARQSFMRMVETAVPGAKVSNLAAALRRRDHAAFKQEATALMELVPNSVLKTHTPRESIFQTALFGALYSALPFEEALVTVENAVQRGRADIIIHFKREPQDAWVIELGLGKPNETAASKLEQAQLYAAGFIHHPTVYCCAMLISEKAPTASTGDTQPVVTYAWSRRVSSGENPNWEQLETLVPQSS